MSDFIFVSPTVKVKEIDNSQYTSGINLGFTSLGLLGETPIGPAFQPIQITSKSQYRKIFGGKSTEKIGGNLKYTLPYYADSFLSEGNNLFVTRILGQSGYASGKGWGVKILANPDLTTISNGSSSTGTTTYTDNIFSGVTIAATGVTYTGATSFTRPSTQGSNFTRTYFSFIATTMSGSTGNVTYTATTQTATPYSTYEGMVVALLRSRGRYTGEVLGYNVSGVTISSSATTAFGTFTISGDTGNAYDVSINPNDASYVEKVLGTSFKDKTSDLFVEKSYPDLINQLYNNNIIYSVATTLATFTETTEFQKSWQTPETPWIVSMLKGNSVDKLFKFIPYADGESANTFIKVSIANVKPETGEFDVLVRNFNDTDDNLLVLETYSRCTLDKSSTNFIGKRIGDNGENYNNISSYMYISWFDFDNIDQDTVPAGFEGYNLRSYTGTTNPGLTPSIQYKTSYSTVDKTSRTYLGVSERGYDSLTTIGSGLNSDLFQYSGNLSASVINKSKGFHFDSGATGTYSVGQFYTGADSFSFTSVTDVNNQYYSVGTRKFTVAFYGGFDGWDGYRDARTITSSYAKGGSKYFATADYQAWLSGIQKFNNPEETPINLLATPGINWSDNLTLVNEVLDLVENERGDFLYIIDAPDLPTSTTDTYAADISSIMLATGIDSNYACTYGPHIQFLDTDNNINVYIPPTGEVARSMAYTDNKFYSWFAPAGLNRGVLNSNKIRFKLKESYRDILYTNRINPIAMINGVVDIFGQKTLQKSSSALDRINVRRLLLYLGRTFSNIARTLLFDPEDSKTQSQFIDQVNPILMSVKAERGLVDAKVVYSNSNTPDTLERNELYFDLYIKPMKATEYIGLTFYITPQGASLQNV